MPAIQHLLDYPRRKPGAPRILILTPTRELAMQVAEQAEELAQFTHLKIATITGGVAYQNHGEVFNFKSGYRGSNTGAFYCNTSKKRILIVVR